MFIYVDVFMSVSACIEQQRVGEMRVNKFLSLKKMKFIWMIMRSEFDEMDPLILVKFAENKSWWYENFVNLYL